MVLIIMTEEQLSKLIQKYAEGVASEEEVRQLMNWYQASYVEEVHWLSANPQEKQDTHDRILQRLYRQIAPAPIFRLSWINKAAIFILVTGAAFLLLYYFNSFSGSYITVANPAGKIQLVKLPDNSQVWLNASSTLQYEENFKKDRRLKLNGEAYFEVTHDATHPFMVDAGGVQTTVLGTSFSVKAYDSDKTTNVSVISGRVKVENDKKELAVLTPEMQLSFDRQQQKWKTTKIDTSSITAWRRGKLIFDGASFFEIANTLEIWYGVEIVFDNAAIGNCRYYMSFDSDTPIQKLLTTMAEITETSFVIDKNSSTVTVTGENCP
jgi:transmembrane sensor